MEIIHLVRCGRSGNGYPDGRVFRDGERLLTVIPSTRINTAGHPGMTVCPKDDCWRIVNVTARLATDAEIATYEQEQAEQRERLATYEAKVMERRRAYLASRAEPDSLATSGPGGRPGRY
jgi:hypothetical protein